MMEKFFSFKKRGTSARTEVLAGIATFLTMSYIIVVNPAILSDSGMDFNGVLFATVLVSSLSSIFMGLFANLPYALAPGMGLNAFFTYTMVLGGGFSWQTALGAVFISGIIFIILSLTKVRTIILRAVPASIRYAVAGGIGLFIALIGLRSVDFIVPNPATTIAFGGINPTTAIFVGGLLLTGFLVVKRIKGALIIGIAATSIVALIVSQFIETPLVTMPTRVFALPSLSVFFQLDILGALKFSLIGPIFALLFTDMFDSISTFLGIATTAGLVDKEGQPINGHKALLVDAVSTTISGLFGTSSGTTYIESAAGIEEGGRTGLTAVVAGLLFLPFMFFSPILSFIPAIATAPVLVIVGLFMMTGIVSLDWKNYEESLPAFLAFILIPLTYNITQGIIWGLLFYTAIKIIRGKAREVHPMLYIIDVLAIVGLILHIF
ncbi:MAG: NCS2 family permease [Actinobacteria bacterium]|nr:NCS2 family permease [Actinomycetota bacterium]